MEAGSHAEGSHRQHRREKRQHRRPIRHSVCMVSDFFYPNLGGVEMHIYSLAQCLMQRGHKVIVVTHGYGDRAGVRYMTNGLKVYYIPVPILTDQAAWPTIFPLMPLIRDILVRERITIVHGHQSTSTLSNETILFARAMGYRMWEGACPMCNSIHINKVLQFVLSDIDHVICVSHTCRENLVVRAALHPSHVSTIPNALDPTNFVPDTSRRFPANTVNIVLISRLVYRKGIDLLVHVIPIVCARFPWVRFIIGGDGPKRVLLEQMKEQYQLHDRIELLGAVAHHRVRDVLNRGHIFLNCSLTESFCIALLEAAACGLYVVSTNVGGVPEVLPPSMITFAKPDVEDLVNALSDSLSLTRKVSPAELHQKVKQMYSWLDVAVRTENVYNEISTYDFPSTAERLARYLSAGAFFGFIACTIAALLLLCHRALEYMRPASEIEPAPDMMLRRHKGHSTRKSLGRAHAFKSNVNQSHSSDQQPDNSHST